ncbi:hypothetical protein M0813_21255 [Anaeramoeba flamelloides]|uniref:Uncharacterized protein n=1 Tax=Anaeramoeba flamelloides TaxID=1746091 RepID=A0ABQ8YHC2_9EUKA|nr:hypothetical protein M0813_21255 [Anaeramoeba flamelloides]
MGNKHHHKIKGYSSGLPDTPTIRRKGSKTWDLFTHRDPFKILPFQLKLKLEPNNFAFYTPFGKLIRSYSYYDLEEWGSKKNNLFLKISGKIIILSFNNAKIIDKEINIYINQIYVDLKRVREEENIFNQKKNELGVPVDEETGMPLRLKNETMDLILEEEKNKEKEGKGTKIKTKTGKKKGVEKISGEKSKKGKKNQTNN